MLFFCLYFTIVHQSSRVQSSAHRDYWLFKGMTQVIFFFPLSNHRGLALAHGRLLRGTDIVTVPHHLLLLLNLNINKNLLVRLCFEWGTLNEP